MDRHAIERLIDTLIAALQHEPIDPVALTFLLRCYGATDRSDLREALEPALATALDRPLAADTLADRAAWLVLFADALALSSDDRLSASATALVGALRAEWGRSADVAGAAMSVDACLRASRSVELGPIVADAIDELERLVATAYRPGEGLVLYSTHPPGAGVALGGYVALSSALLSAYDMSGRLPYPMLAEELMQFARRTLWDDRIGCFSDASVDAAETLRLNCDAARVLCWLEALRRDTAYLKAAVGSDPGYARDASRILSTPAIASAPSAAIGGAYGLALTEWLALS